jgi:hypothetical protein
MCVSVLGVKRLHKWDLDLGFCTDDGVFKMFMKACGHQRQALLFDGANALLPGCRSGKIVAEKKNSRNRVARRAQRVFLWVNSRSGVLRVESASRTVATPVSRVLAGVAVQF